MRLYELVLVLKSSLKDADKKKTVDSIKEALGKVKFQKDNEMGQKPLSYPIKKEVSGYFLALSFEGENIPSDFEKNLINNDNILRHLLLRK
ncbi:MAG: 30S ribosomal protein S6 [Candidatus Levybacteria bacterium]|nr:30S ribosomal protein S6 [Candidatus Levybacteria bacterium]MBI2421082.1 30S ribosomal protein S6 [Candidatus Levybacteria bacterium]